MNILPSDAAREAANVVGAILLKHKGTWPSRNFFEQDYSRIWDELVAGGWVTLGLTEAAGGAGLSLLDLAQVAEVWGRHLVPLAYIPTMLIWRWSNADPDTTAAAPLTYSLPSYDAASAAALSPFLGVRGTRLVAGIASLSTSEPHDEPAGHSDEWAPSLPIGLADRPTVGLPDAARAEIATLGAAELVGCGSAALQQALSYARERVQFGRTIGEYQAVQHRLADMHRDLEVARTAVVWAANEPDRAAGAVGIACNRVRAVVEGCIQIHGGIGFTWEAGFHYYARHVWAWNELFRACGVRLWPA